MCSMCVKTPKVHSQYHRNPPSWTCHLGTEMPRKKDRESREFVKDAAKGKEKRKYMRKRRGCWYFAYLATSSSKAMFCLQHMGEWECKFFLLFSLNPPNSLCWFSLFLSAFMFPFFFSLYLQKLLQLLSSWLFFGIDFTSFLLFTIKHHNHLYQAIPLFSWFTLNATPMTLYKK